MTNGSSLPTLKYPPRRVLFFGKNMSRSRATGGLVEALRRQDLNVRWLNIATLRRWLGRDRAIRSARRTFARFQPDIVFVFCRDLPFALLKGFGESATTVVWVEEPLENMNEEYVDYLAEADAVFITNPAKLPWLRSRGVSNVGFVLEGFSPSSHFPVSSREYERDVVFIGGPGREGKRAKFLAKVADRFELDVFGSRWDEWANIYPNLRVHGPVKPRAFRQLCASSRIVLGLNQVNGDHLYFSNRTFLTLACRGFHLTHYVPGLEQIFHNRDHLCWYDDADDCLAQIAYYLKHETERSQIARAGCDYVQEHHRFDSRVQYILHTLRAGVFQQPDWLRFDPSVEASQSLTGTASE